MGLAIEKDSFTEEDYKNFKDKLQSHLKTLSGLLDDPNFGQGEQTIGAELETSVTDQNGDPSLISHQVIKSVTDPQLQHELNQYNLEYNLLPTSIKGKPFTNLKHQAKQAIEQLNQYCEPFNSQVVPIGILPSLQEKHVNESVMTDELRYKALSNGIKRLKQGKFHLNINGRESIQMINEGLTLEGANTSFQVQVKIPPQDFPDVFNAFQIATPLAVAVSANSPILLNKFLWDETRIALFKQAVDCRRDEHHTEWRQPHRVSYGYGWVRRSALECFAENVALFPPLLPVCKPEHFKSKPGDGPDLFELKLHQGVVWHWNRAIYDEIQGGHLRIEIRSLPSGPTVSDMVANAAFLIGLAYAIKKDIKNFLVSYPFMFAEYNFYRAAKHGLDAQLVWPLYQTDYSQSRPILEILDYYIPLAKESLLELGVDQDEVEPLINIIKARIQAKQNGSIWQRKMVEQYESSEDRVNAIKLMLNQYIINAKSERPVHEWSIQK